MVGPGAGVAPLRAPGRVRRDGLPAMLIFVAAPFLALLLGALAHPVGLLDSEEEIRARTGAWRPLAAKAAFESGVPLDLLLALVATESSGRADAVSSAGALGLAQVMPATAVLQARVLSHPEPDRVDALDPGTNLRLGASYLAEQLGRFDGDPALALAAYHSGPGVPWKWTREEPGRAGIDLVRARGTPRTRAYVERVLERREWFAEGGKGKEGEGKE